MLGLNFNKKKSGQGDQINATNITSLVSGSNNSHASMYSKIDMKSSMSSQVSEPRKENSVKKMIKDVMRKGSARKNREPEVEESKDL